MGVNKAVQAQLKSVIKTLPKTEDGIAGFLGRLGVKGKTSCEEKCVLANFFAAAMGKPFTTVDGNSVSVYASKQAFKDGDEIASMSLPYPATNFVGDFDGHQYPFLVGKMSADAIANVQEEFNFDSVEGDL